jgi:hypothetical protein
MKAPESVTVDELLDQVKDTWSGIMEDLEAERAKFGPVFEEIRVDAAEAVLARDLDTIQLLGETVQAKLVEQAITVRGLERSRLVKLGSNVLSGLLKMASLRIAPLLALLLLFSGCALMHRGTVPSKGISPLFTHVCAIVDDCVKDRVIPDGSQACDPQVAGSLAAMLETQRTITGADLGAQVEDVCGRLDACIAGSPDLPAYRKRSLIRGCDTLQAVAAAAIAE